LSRFSSNIDTFRYLNYRKLKNVWSIWNSYHRSKNKGIASLTANPFALSIEPTTACNLGCPECPSGLRKFDRNTGNLKPAFFDKIISEIEKDLIYLTFYFQGEPFINPGFLEMVKVAHERKIYTATSTNAHFLDEENAIKTIESGLDKLVISLDGTTQEIYEKYRINGQLDKVLNGTKELVKWKKKLNVNHPRIVFQFLVVAPNEHQINDAKLLAKEIGVDEIKFKTAQIYDYVNGHPLIPSIDKYSRYKKQDNGTYVIKNELSNHCWRMWHSCVITWDGLIVPCCFDKNAKHQLGDLKIDAFSDVWLSPKYFEFRNSILKSRHEIDICTNCTEGTKVWN